MLQSKHKFGGLSYVKNRFLPKKANSLVKMIDLKNLDSQITRIIIDDNCKKIQMK